MGIRFARHRFWRGPWLLAGVWATSACSNTPSAAQSAVGFGANACGDTSVTAQAQKDAAADAQWTAASCADYCRTQDQLCAWMGQCTGVVDTTVGCVCLAKNDADCAKSGVCHAYFQCAAAGNVCTMRPTTAGSAAATVEVCQGGPCYHFGQCTAAGESCLAATDFDCRLGNLCALEGKCTSCKEHGSCAQLPGPPSLSQPTDRCEAGSDADCAGSLNCQRFGACRLKNYANGASGCWPMADADCAASAMCKAIGECHLVGQACAPASAADCAASEGCAKVKRCQYSSALRACVL